MNSAERLSPMGIKPENYVFEYFPNKIQTLADTPALNKTKSKKKYFQDDPEGNILIFYPSIDGAGIVYRQTEKSHEYYTRVRFSDPEAHKDKDGKPVRYKSESGSGIEIFIPAGTLDKIRKAEKFETLHIVEGEFKAVFGDFFGLDIIGIAGIQMFIEKKGSKRLHPVIREIIETCRVKNLNLLFDADCRLVTFDFQNNPNKDYSDRLISFQSAVINFKIACTEWNEDIDNHNLLVEANGKGEPKPRLHYFYTQIRQEFSKTAKGLDDLFCEREKLNATHEQIVSDLNGLSKSKNYFFTLNLESNSKAEIDRHFWLDADRTGRPVSFYNNFTFEIKDQKFVFWENVYRWNYEKNELDILFHKKLQEYIRVGIKYFRKIKKTAVVLGKDNEKIFTEKRSITQWNRQEITTDFVEGKGIKSAFHAIPKFTDFCNIPGHDREYKAIYNDEYNIYYPIPWEPKPGNWSNIQKFLRHLSQNQFQNKYDILLDILCLKYINPIAKLPIIVLYSREKNTGKSTLLWFLNDIYGDNSSLISNNDLTLDFNDYLLGNVLLIDEAIIVDKALEMLKSLSTAPETSINMKNMPKLKVSFFGTFFITTNRLTFVRIDEDENRFFILHVPTVSETDPTLREKMREEIPAFLYYLRYHHKLKYERSQSRFWFPFRDYVTSALTELKQKSKQQSLRALHEWVREMFFTHLITEFEAAPVVIIPQLRKYTSRDISFTELTNTLKDDMNLIPSKVHRYKFPKLIDNFTGEPETEWQAFYFDRKGAKQYYSGATYTLKAADFLDTEERMHLDDLIEKNKD